MEDQSKFFNVIIDRTNQKLNSFQAQVIVLESQLQMAIEERDTYKSYLEKMSGQGVSSNEINNYSVLQEQLKAVEEENNILKQQLASSSANIDSSTKFVRDQNETLLQEIRRLKAELSSLSGK
jgi:flagellar biosynthesis chaperone FliJ